LGCAARGVTGGGPTTPSLPIGQIAPADGSPLYMTTRVPTVTIGGLPATVSFSGLTPGIAGEYQANVTIPATVAAGDQVPLVMSIGGSSDTVTIAIQVRSASCYTSVYTDGCVAMPTNLAIDDNLIEEARRIGQHKTKKEAVTQALSEYIAQRKRLEILSAFGTVDFDPKYSYKAERNRKR